MILLNHLLNHMSLRYLVFFIFIFSLILIPRSLEAVGISPTRLEIFNLLPENRVEKKFSVSRVKIETQEEFSLSLAGPGQEAIVLPQGQTIVFKPGERVVNLPFIIAPASFPEGTNQAKLAITAKATSNINLKLEAVIVFSVTLEPETRFLVYNITLEEAQGETPVKLRYQARNDGNTAVSFGQIILTTLALPGAQVRHAVIQGKELPEIAPFSHQEARLPLPRFLPPGAHSLNVVFYGQAGQVLASSEKPVLIFIPPEARGKTWRDFWFSFINFFKFK